ncbi:hypothetical protein GPECTOR_55g324 [Gonium pectorale]|uniref:Uncharacterized protein n=1 Tax=Gonium pectorale TaxID=33097 RepID=A0A150G6F6_GONPE|nr:hypothetical protein GPECTOR_55g324 [Gonium pectorale]|eukprot:KXZ45418.1 hypothetical protein GPECTOR_55g324 [Gonium pectorale]
MSQGRYADEPAAGCGIDVADGDAVDGDAVAAASAEGGDGGGGLEDGDCGLAVYDGSLAPTRAATDIGGLDGGFGGGSGEGRGATESGGEADGEGVAQRTISYDSLPPTSPFPSLLKLREHPLLPPLAPPPPTPPAEEPPEQPDRLTSEPAAPATAPEPPALPAALQDEAEAEEAGGYAVPVAETIPWAATDTAGELVATVATEAVEAVGAVGAMEAVETVEPERGVALPPEEARAAADVEAEAVAALEGMSSALEGMSSALEGVSSAPSTHVVPPLPEEAQVTNGASYWGGEERGAAARCDGPAPWAAREDEAAAEAAAAAAAAWELPLGQQPDAPPPAVAGDEGVEAASRAAAGAKAAKGPWEDGHGAADIASGHGAPAPTLTAVPAAMAAAAARTFAPAPPLPAPLVAPVVSSLSDLPDIVTLLTADPGPLFRSGPTRVRKMDY